MKKNVLLFVVFMFTNFIFGDNPISLPQIINPDGIYIADGRLYITEKTKINIFSLKNFSLIKAFGTEGEGPQEFKDRIYYIYFRNDTMVINSMGKVSYYTKDGTYLKEKRFIAANSGDYCPIGKKFVGIQFKSEKKSFFQTLNIFDSNMNKIKEIARIEDDFQPGKGMRAFIEPQSYTVMGNKIYITFNLDLLITVFFHNGEKLFTIKEDYQRLKLTEKYKKAVYFYFKTDPYYKKYYQRIKQNLTFPDLLPAIRFFTSSNTKFYVGTYKKIDGKTEFFIFSSSGKLLRKVLIPLVEPEGFEYKTPILFNFEYDKLFQLVENEDDSWEVHITKI